MRRPADTRTPGHTGRRACVLGWSLVILASLAVNVGVARAQDVSKEIWPEIDTWLRLSPAWRFSVFVPLSKNLETYYREGSLVLQADYSWGRSRFLFWGRLVNEDRARVLKTLMVRGGYLMGRSLGDHGEEYSENTLLLEEHFRIPLKSNVLFTQRLRQEARRLGDNDISARFRYRVQMEMEFTAGGGSIVPYVNGEAYFDSRYSTFNRVRLIGGATVSWWRYVGLEANMTYQHDTRSSIEHLIAMNVILHVFFDTGDDE